MMKASPTPGAAGPGQMMGFATGAGAESVANATEPESSRPLVVSALLGTGAVALMAVVVLLRFDDGTGPVRAIALEVLKAALALVGLGAVGATLGSYHKGLELRRQQLYQEAAAAREHQREDANRRAEELKSQHIRARDEQRAQERADRALRDDLVRDLRKHYVETKRIRRRLKAIIPSPHTRAAAPPGSVQRVDDLLEQLDSVQLGLEVLVYSAKAVAPAAVHLAVGSMEKYLRGVVRHLPAVPMRPGEGSLPDFLAEFDGSEFERLFATPFDVAVSYILSGAPTVEDAGVMPPKKPAEGPAPLAVN